MENKAERYRRRADALRAIAAHLIDAGARATLLEVAKDYERMARAAEKADGDSGRPAKPDGKDEAKRPR